MRRMWLWVLIYALGAGFILFLMILVCGLGTDVVPVRSVPSFISPDIINPLLYVGISAPSIGFWVLITAMILLLIRRTIAAGRIVSLIGLGMYYLAGLSLVLSAIFEEYLPLELVVFILVMAVVIGVPGFFITRTLLRAIKAEKSET
jgi:hypothetical protein